MMKCRGLIASHPYDTGSNRANENRSTDDVLITELHMSIWRFYRIYDVNGIDVRERGLRQRQDKNEAIKIEAREKRTVKRFLDCTASDF